MAIKDKRFWALRNVVRAADEPALRTALADTLWAHFVQSSAPEHAVIWRDSDQLLRSQLDDFLTAVDQLHNLGRQLNAPSDPATPRKTLYVFLLGSGAGYE